MGILVHILSSSRSMIIEKIGILFTEEELAVKLAAIHRFMEESQPFYTHGKISELEKCVQRYAEETGRIETQVKYRYILAFDGDKTAIMRDVDEILEAVTKEDFRAEIEANSQYPVPEDTSEELAGFFRRRYTEDYPNFCAFLTELLQPQIEAFQYYGYPEEEIKELIRQKADSFYQKPTEFDIAGIFEANRKTIPKINTKKLDNIAFPLDKVNSTLWHGFPIGTLTGLKAESDKDSRSGKQANILLFLDFTALGGVNISRELTVYDKWVWNACANLKEQGHDVITAEQIYKAMGNSGRPNPKTKEKILESVEMISRARVSIDTTQEHELYPKYDRLKATFPLLATEICTAYARGQVIEDAIRIIEMPKLFTFAENRQQVTRLPLNVLESPISKTDDNLLLSDYLLTRISKMRNSKYVKRTILLDTIYQKCGIEERYEKFRAREKIEKILNHYKQIGWIKDYQMTNREIEITTHPTSKI